MLGGGGGCETYVVHHFVDTGIGHAQGGPVSMSMRSGDLPQHFSFCGGLHGTCTKRNFFPYLVGHKEHSAIFLCLTTNMQINMIKVHNIVLYRHTLW